MNSFNQIQEYSDEANQLAGKGRLIEAMKSMRMAIEIAKKNNYVDQIPDLFSSLLLFNRFIGDNHKCLNLLLELRDSSPQYIGAKEEMEFKSYCFNILCEEKPDLLRLESQLNEMEEYNIANGNIFDETVKSCRNVLAGARGYWEMVLAEAEISIASSDSANSCDTCPKSVMVSDSLQARDFVKAQFWLRKVEQSSPSIMICQLHKTKAQLDFALSNQAVKIAEKYADRLEELRRQTSSPFLRYYANGLIVRSRILNTSNGDPLDPSHKARQVMTRQAMAYTNLASKFSHALLMIDFRLASLRYAGGFFPVDDLYYKCENETRGASISISISVLEIRTEKVLTAIKRAQKLAKMLDHSFVCTWRVALVDSRKKRLISILNLIPELKTFFV